MKKILMVNMVKRVFAVLLAFSLCAGNLLLPAAAEETDGNVVVVTETVTTSGGVTHTETTTTESWSDSETKGGDTGKSGNTATPEVTSDTTLTKNEGTETTVDVTDTKGSKPVAASQEVSGENTTTITQETKTEHTETETKPAEDSFKYTQKENTETTTPTETTASTESTEPVSLDRPTAPNVTLEMTQQKNTASAQISAAEAAATKYNLKEIEQETTTVEGNQTDENGQTTVTRTPIKLNDTVIGYQIITTNVKVTQDVKTSDAVADTQNKSEIPVTGKPVTEGTTTTTYRMPEEPKGGVTKNSDGTTVTTTVEKLMEGGVHVGYKTTAVTTDAKGKELNRSSENIYRTEITTKSQTASVTTTTTTTTPLTNKRTTTTVTTTIVDTQGRKLVPMSDDQGNWYWVYSAELGSVAAGTGNGAINMDSLKPKQEEPGVGKVDKDTDLYNRKNQTPNNVALEGWPLIWKGEYGLESAIRVQAKNCQGDNRTFQPHQFILNDGNGNDFYVYCADFEVSPYNGYRYNMENVEDADYYDNDAAKHIRYIALNGYWGTIGAEGTETCRGSLDYVKNLMKTATDDAGKRLFTDEEIDGLTPGEALTATQAAIWYFGNSNTDQNSGIDKEKGVVGKYYNGDGSKPAWGEVSLVEKDRINKLFNFFISQTEEAAPGTTIINENNFATKAELTVKEKVANATNLNEGEPQTQQRDTYKTDLSFSLLLEPNEGDELSVTVLDSESKVLKQVKLCGKDSDSVWKQWLSRDKDQMYTIKDLEIAEGVTVTLNLSGTQNLEPGVYLYTSEVRTDQETQKDITSQTFVGVADGTREVNLNVNLKFDVQDPQLAVKSNTKQETATKTNTKVETGTGTRTEVTESKHITVTETVTESTRSTWYSSWSRRFSSNNGGGGGDDGNGGGGNTGGRRRGTSELLSLKKNELVIPDEEVPLAKVPVTGDNSAIWFALGVLSLAGLVLLNSKRKKVQY